MSQAGSHLNKVRPENAVEFTAAAFLLFLAPLVDTQQQQECKQAERVEIVPINTTTSMPASLSSGKSHAMRILQWNDPWHTPPCPCRA